MTNDDAIWLRRYYADWDSGDIEAITSWFDDDVLLEDVPTGHVARGSAEARTFVGGALAMAPGASYEVLSVLVDGNPVCRRVGHAASRSAWSLSRDRPQQQDRDQPRFLGCLAE